MYSVEKKKCLNFLAFLYIYIMTCKTGDYFSYFIIFQLSRLDKREFWSKGFKTNVRFLLRFRFMFSRIFFLPILQDTVTYFLDISLIKLNGDRCDRWISFYSPKPSSLCITEYIYVQFMNAPWAHPGTIQNDVKHFSQL